MVPGNFDLCAFTENTIVPQGVLDPGTEFLSKPFTPAGLARNVRDVLGGQ